MLTGVLGLMSHNSCSRNLPSEKNVNYWPSLWLETVILELLWSCHTRLLDHLCLGGYFSGMNSKKGLLIIFSFHQEIVSPPLTFCKQEHKAKPQGCPGPALLGALAASGVFFSLKDSHNPPLQSPWIKIATKLDSFSTVPFTCVLKILISC